MKAAVMTFACSCVWGWNGAFLLAEAPLEGTRSVVVRSNQELRLTERPKLQIARKKVLPIASGTAADKPAQEAEAVIRPWEVADAPGLLPTAHRPAAGATTTVHQAELAGGNVGGSAPAAHPTWYSNSLRQRSTVAASKLASPANPARPAPRQGGRTLLGDEAEYHERDQFSYSVESTPPTNRPRTFRAQQPASATAPRPLKEATSIVPGEESKARPQAAPRPLTTSAVGRRTAASRWFKQNPLRYSVLASGSQQRTTYVQQTSAQVPAGETLPPPAAVDEDVPSIGAEQPLPFDLNPAERESSGPTTLKIKAAAASQAAEPADEKPAEPVDDGLSVDDLPEFDSEKKAPTESKLPDSPFAAPAKSNAPPATTAAEKNAAPAETDPDLDLPFDLPPTEKKPTAETSQDELPTQENPADELPFDTFPPQEKPTEDAPADEPRDDLPADDPRLEMPSEEPVATEATGLKLKPLSAIAISITPPPGELPADRAKELGAGSVVVYGTGHASRGWAVSTYNWEASAMKHQPLYFEEVNLERYGYSRGLVQPAVSYGQFLMNVIAMPYKVMAEPPREEIYTLGQTRPGDYTPYRIHYPPRSAAGGMFEAGVVLGLVFLIP